jgi:asparagine synthase (glutamine-hydrolysing)
MCGICGIIYTDPERNVDEKLVHNMNDSIKHRGPDDSGVYINKNVGLGFRRLAIIDLSPAGHQPMTNEDGSVWIIFNGEIYNHLELWEEEGEWCVEKLRGMFAFAIWDSNQQTLLLARDREGKKPLYFAELQDRLLFGSEIKAILQDPAFTARPDLEAIHLYLAYQSVPAPYSAFKGIKKLPPAHTLLYKNGQVTLRRYWKLSYKEKRIIKTPQDEIALQEEIIERLREAVGLRLMSDVPLGAFLSGGIDSSIIVALMAGLMEQPVKTFSIGFTYEEYNELPYARQVAEQYRASRVYCHARRPGYYSRFNLAL